MQLTNLELQVRKSDALKIVFYHSYSPLLRGVRSFIEAFSVCQYLSIFNDLRSKFHLVIFCTLSRPGGKR